MISFKDIKNVAVLVKMTQKIFFGIGIFLLFGSELINAQTQQLFTSQQFRLGERIVRISEPGELSDSVNVWGDIGSPGRYLIPKGTSLATLLSYTFGPLTIRDAETNIDWSKLRVEINIQQFDAEKGINNIEKYKYKFDEPFPEGFNNFALENNQTISVRVKRKPAFIDYVRVVAPVISAIGTAITAFVLLDSR
ncbi:MAG: hypothetical protein RLN81_08560 [Balneolaceae bacterium]